MLFKSVVRQVKAARRKRQPVKQAESHLEVRLESKLSKAKIKFVKQYRFHPVRRWLFDFYIPCANLLIDCQGGIFISGKHVTGKGYENDCEKMCAAVALGYQVIWVTDRQVRLGGAMDTIRTIVKDCEVEDGEV